MNSSIKKKVFRFIGGDLFMMHSISETGDPQANSL